MSNEDKLKNGETIEEFPINVNTNDEDITRKLNPSGTWGSEEDIEREKHNRRIKRYNFFSKIFPRDANGYFSQRTLEKMYDIYRSPESDDADRWAIESLVVENFENYIAACSRKLSYNYAINENIIEEIMDILRVYVLYCWRCYDTKHETVFLGFIRIGCLGTVKDYFKKKLKYDGRISKYLDDDTDNNDELIIADPNASVETRVQKKMLAADIYSSLNELELFVVEKRADGYSEKEIAEAVVAAGLKAKYNASQVSKLLSNIRKRFEGCSDL